MLIKIVVITILTTILQQFKTPCELFAFNCSFFFIHLLVQNISTGHSTNFSSDATGAGEQDSCKHLSDLLLHTTLTLNYSQMWNKTVLKFKKKKTAYEARTFKAKQDSWL